MIRQILKPGVPFRAAIKDKICLTWKTFFFS